MALLGHHLIQFFLQSLDIFSIGMKRQVTIYEFNKPDKRATVISTSTTWKSAFDGFGVEQDWSPIPSPRPQPPVLSHTVHENHANKLPPTTHASCF